ncbi:hypothetical protein OG524_18825 [Streptomyces sp. NBC_01520]|uniref:hypothetical protein n=1 Tax=Streptomyces sp. NBC_01520 TaxID=2903892 RepID=UPI00386D4097
MNRNDPESVAEARRRGEQQTIARWRTKLIGELRDLVDRKTSRTYQLSQGLLNLEREREIELRSLHELISRGLHPSKTRTFQGRILLTVRCKEKGHILARVYPTPYRHVFIPQSASLPAGQTKDKRFAHAEAMKALRRFFPEINQRDAWISEYSDEERREILVQREQRTTGPASKDRLIQINTETTDFDIRGMTVLAPHHGEREVTWEGVRVEPSWYLLCRCGTRILASYLVVDALMAGTEKIFV